MVSVGFEVCKRYSIVVFLLTETAISASKVRNPKVFAMRFRVHVDERHTTLLRPRIDGQKNSNDSSRIVLP